MTMREDLMKRLLRGWVTPLSAFVDCNCLSLSQRAGEFQREFEAWRWTIPGTQKPPRIEKKWVKLKSGKTVRAYRAVK